LGKAAQPHALNATATASARTMNNSDLPRLVLKTSSGKDLLHVCGLDKIKNKRVVLPSKPDKLGNRAGPVVSRIIQKDRVHPRCHRKYTIGEAHVLAADENPSIFDERHEYEFLHGEIPH
jgi:hypothetical protein